MASAWGLNPGAISRTVKLQATSAICSCCCRPVACGDLQLACCAKLLLNLFLPVALAASKMSGDSLIRASFKSRPAHRHVLIYQAGQNPSASGEHRAGVSCDDVGMQLRFQPNPRARLVKVDWPCSIHCSYAVSADLKGRRCVAKRLDLLAWTFLPSSRLSLQQVVRFLLCEMVAS